MVGTSKGDFLPGADVRTDVVYPTLVTHGSTVVVNTSLVKCGRTKVTATPHAMDAGLRHGR